MKGIILTAGKGTRLYPLTKIIPKVLLPIYDKPMINYPIDKLLSLGVDEFLIVVSEDGLNPIRDYLSQEYKDLNISYKVQNVQNGIAGALQLGKDFIGADDYFYLMLGDNIFIGDIEAPNDKEPTIYSIEVSDPERFGVWDEKNKKVVEKPKEYISNEAVIGLYYLPNKAMDYTFEVQPSARGELEIVDVLNKIENLRKKKFNGRWFDTGTFDSLLDCANYKKLFKGAYKNNEL